MDWNDFARRLAAELVLLPVDAYVIVQGSGGFPYVQAMRHAGGLAGEAVSDAYLAESQRLDLVQIERMISLGWREPDGHNRVNWWHDLDLPADMELATPAQLAECDHLAVRMVAALRDVYGVPDPGQLEYRAGQNGRDGGPLPLPGLGIRGTADRQPLTAPAQGTGRSETPGAGRSETPGAGRSEASGIGWSEFAERLAGALAGLDDGMALVVHRADQDAYYVQAHRDPRRIRAEAVGNDMLDEPLRLSDADVKRLTDAGWGDPGPNWWVELPTEAPATEVRRLAGMMVTALRDVQQAGDPADLRYEAFRGDVGIELMDFGITLADPAAVSERRPVGGLPPADEPAAEPELEEALVAAKRRGDQQAYLALIKENGLIVPSTGRSNVVEFATTNLNDGLYVLTFTTAEAMTQVLGGQAKSSRQVTVAQLAAEWPNPGWKLSINLSLPSEAYFDPSVLTDLAQPAPEPASEAAATVAEPEVDAGVEAEATATPDVMQKVVPPSLVVHYLEGGYDRVAGYVHRVDDVAALTTPEQLISGLGLTYENSPFSAADEMIHVIRWPVHKPELLKTPLGGVDEESMRAMPDGWVIERPPFLGTGFAPGEGPPIPEFKIASQRLPHGAEMYRVDGSGEVTRVAIFDADGPRWVAEES